MEGNKKPAPEREAQARETVRIVGKADEYLRICLMLGVSLKTFVTVKEIPA